MKKQFYLTLLSNLLGAICIAAPSFTIKNIHVDQFGYRCNSQKVAIISSPQVGYNTSTEAFTPGTTANNYQVKRWSDDVVMYTGTLQQWGSGATHATSGDMAWWFDFSSFTAPGNYYIYDISNNKGSYQFQIGDGVFAPVLEQAMRSYYYQRCGIAKTTANAGTGYGVPVCHQAALQDTDCRLYSSPTNVGTSQNLSGGWHDAGDYTKYVNFTWSTLIDLLNGYQQNPSVWLDNYNIPESGNGVPDVLDETKYELDWLLKMQQSNGSVLSIIGHGGGSPPSSDASQAVYGPATTSATFTCAAVFALASIQYKSLGIPAMTTYANTLQTAAINAWNWAVANPNIKWRNNDATYNSIGVGSGQQELDDPNNAATYPYNMTCRQVAAGVFLYALTNNATYKTYVEANYNTVHLVAWGYSYPFESTNQDMLLYYSNLAGITASVGTAIRNAYLSGNNNADNWPHITGQTDAYRAYIKDFVWGSNDTESEQGSMFYNMSVYGIDPTNATNYTNAAEDYIHYIHGVNPNALVYLTNMGAFQAENSASTFYNGWFTDGSALWDQVGVSTYGPPPGYLPGGPNPSWALDGCCPSGCGSSGTNAQCIALSPPSGQPNQKSYLDWNSNWPQDSWEVTENGIYYQAAYIKLLSKFIGTSCGIPLNVNWLNASLNRISVNSVQLNWSTASESNSAYFAIMRSIDGTRFDSIGTIYASGNSTNSKSYQYTDTSVPEGIVYYKIKEVDFNQNISYSLSMSTQGNISTVTVYPNPFDNSLTVNIHSTSIHISDNIQLINILGQTVYESPILSPDSIQLSTENISPGVYILQVNSNNNIYSTKVVRK